MSPTYEENLRAMGTLVLNCAFVYQMAWLPVIFFLEGANWVSGAFAVGAHRFALAYMVLSPLAYGIRVKLRGAGREELSAWLLRCLLPMWTFAGLTWWVEKTVSVTGGVIAGMMLGGILIAGYGIALRREGVPAAAS